MELTTLTKQLELISALYAQKFDVQRTPEWFLLKLTEELGELMQSYLQYAGQTRGNGQAADALRMNLEDELADVLAMTMLVANHHQIDLEEAISRKWLKYLDSAMESDGQ